jgi:hypothetical protein
MLGFGYPISPEWAPEEASELATWIVGLVMVALFLAVLYWTSRPRVRPSSSRGEEIPFRKAA